MRGEWIKQRWVDTTAVQWGWGWVGGVFIFEILKSSVSGMYLAFQAKPPHIKEKQKERFVARKSNQSCFW